MKYPDYNNNLDIKQVEIVYAESKLFLHCRGSIFLQQCQTSRFPFCQLKSFLIKRVNLQGLIYFLVKQNIDFDTRSYYK